MCNRRSGPVRAWRWSVVVALAAMGLTSVASSAVAQAPAPEGLTPSQYQEDVTGAGRLPNMFATNVPYVAWRGEQIRAVKCDANLKGAVDADVDVLDWSGDPDFKPVLEDGTLRFFWGRNRLPCISFNMVSHHAGLGTIELVPNDGEGKIVGEKHDFLMIWLTIGNVVIDEVGANDPTGDAPKGSNAEVGDPLGDGNFDAGDPYGRVSVNVTGTFPGSAKLGGGTKTLPQDWPQIATQYATDSNPLNDPDAQRWDIHDDQTDATGHVRGFCLFPSSYTVDAVDNCWDTGGDYGWFSTAFGTGNWAAGPFDPARPATLLSNGAPVNEDDAPMPALRVDVSIAPNSGANGDLSGVGQLLKSDKSDVYSRDGSGGDHQGPRDAHNLYAPYYKQWIPATTADSYAPEASGISGPCTLNNNAGFLACGQYDNWDTTTIKKAWDGPTQCNQYVDWQWSVDGQANGASAFDGGPRPPYGPKDTPRRNPYGPQTVAVYTDEHGEAQVRYDPYAGGFFYDNLIGDGPGQAILNDNRGCDLQFVTKLGTSTITAKGIYPYKQVDAPNVDSGPAPLVKTVYNEFDKSMYYYPKGKGAANQNARIVVVHANDVNGVPFRGEKVCFYLDDNADGVRGFQGETGLLPDAPAEPAMSMEELGMHDHGRPPKHRRFRVEGGYAPKYAGDICRTLDRNGNAAIEVFNSGAELINVITEFLDEGLLRDIDVDFRVANSGSDVNPPTGGKDDNSDCRRTVSGCPRSGTTAPNADQIRDTAGAQAASLLPAIRKAKPSSRRITVRRVTLRRGKYALTIRVNSTRRSETVRIRVGKRTLKRRVKTNRLVTLNGLAIPKGVNVSVTLAS